MKTVMVFQRLLLSGLVLTGVLLTSCSKETTKASEKAAPAESALASDPLQIQATDGVLTRIRVGVPGYADVGATLAVAARVEADETRIARVGSPVMGRIAQLEVLEGQDVKKGQILALLHSTGLNDAQLSLLKGVSQKLVAQRAVERAQVLLKAQVIGVAELQRREAELSQATAELDAARDELDLLGMPASAISDLEKTRTINSAARIIATMDGTVMVRNVTPGQVVQPADTIFEIADLSNLWLIADVPEQAAGRLVAGHVVEAEVEALPGQVLRGQLAFVSHTVNRDTRTIRVRMNLPNPRRVFKPAMLATMTLKNQLERKAVVPSTAVVRENNTDYVFVQMDERTFLLHPVELGGEFNGKRVLIDGVRSDEKIVVDGAFHLNNERKRLAVQGS